MASPVSRARGSARHLTVTSPHCPLSPWACLLLPWSDHSSIFTGKNLRWLLLTLRIGLLCLGFMHFQIQISINSISPSYTSLIVLYINSCVSRIVNLFVAQISLFCLYCPYTTRYDLPRLNLTKSLAPPLSIYPSKNLDDWTIY